VKLEVGQCYARKDSKHIYYLKLTSVSSDGQGAKVDLLWWSPEKPMNCDFARELYRSREYFEQCDTIDPGKYFERLLQANNDTAKLIHELKENG
jgi:hypothetical protein